MIALYSCKNGFFLIEGVYWSSSLDCADKSVEIIIMTIILLIIIITKKNKLIVIKCKFDNQQHNVGYWV